MSIKILPNKKDVFTLCEFDNDGSISLGEGASDTDTNEKITNIIYILKD